MSEPLPILSPRLEAIPPELTRLPQWVVWEAVRKEDPAKAGGAKVTKVPHDPKTGRNASSTDPATWSDFATAARAYQESRGRFAGVGFVLTPSDPFAGVDLDDAITDTKELTPEAARFVSLLDSYTEVSPSGKGLRVFVRAALPPGGRKRGTTEVYEEGRFLTITGRSWRGTPAGIEARQAEVEEMHREVWPPPPPRPPREKGRGEGADVPQDDNDLLALATRANNGDKIAALYRGDWQGQGFTSQSEADASLCSLLAFWTGDDPARLDRLFRGSALMRPKWDAVRFGNGDTYGARTVAFSLSGCTEFYSPPGSAAAREHGRRKRAEASEAATSAEGLPVIETNGRHLRDVSADALDALKKANDPPQIFVRDRRLVRIGTDTKGRPAIETLSEAALCGHLARAVNFVSTSDKRGAVPVAPSEKVVKDILAMPSWPGFPALDAIVTAPIVAPDGTLVTEPGYQPAARVYYHDAEGLRLPDSTPTPANVQKAKALLLDTLLGDFPFVRDGKPVGDDPDDERRDSASRAHTLGLALVPFVRQVIRGPVPLNLIDAPTPGSGKTLLVQVVTGIFSPGGATVATAPTEEEEWRKRITSALSDGPPFIFFDNIKRRLSSASLAAALTATEWEDRLFGRNDTLVRLPIRCVWVGTANNVEMEDEQVRRTVSIRIDAKQERPEDRQDFKIADIREWTHQNRPQLIAAALTLVRAWLEAGRPTWKGKLLGSYESWCLVVGGILDTIGVPGFLENRTELYERLDPEREKWAGFFEAWYEKHGEAKVKTADVLDLAIEAEIVEHGDSAAKAFGKMLRGRVDRIFGGLRLENAGTVQRVARYRIRKCVSGVCCVSTPSVRENVFRGQEAAGSNTKDGRAGTDTQHTPDTHSTPPDDDDLSDLADPFADSDSNDGHEGAWEEVII